MEPVPSMWTSGKAEKALILTQDAGDLEEERKQDDDNERQTSIIRQEP